MYDIYGRLISESEYRMQRMLSDLERQRAAWERRDSGPRDRKTR